MAESGDSANPDDDLYAEWRCKRCGVCCGSTDGHPCEHLKANGEGKHYCEIYAHRFGAHKTTNGYSFQCVTIKRIIDTVGGYSECAYVQEYLRRASGKTK